MNAREIDARGDTAGSADPGPWGCPGLAARQADLIDALVAGGPLPDGFDASRIGSTRRALLRKRAGEAATVWPLLAASRGADWSGTVAALLDGRPPGGALRDGWDVARELRRRGKLGAAAAAELDEREAGWHYAGIAAPRRRRLPAVRYHHGVAFVQLGGRVARFGRGRS